MNLKAKLNSILLRADRRQADLIRYKNIYLAAIWAHKSLKEKTFKRYFPSAELYRVAIKAQRKAEKRGFKPEDDALFLPLMALFDKQLNSVIVEDRRKTVSQEKKKALEAELKENRKEVLPPPPGAIIPDLPETYPPPRDKPKDYIVFYLASSHGDSAEDHKDWQGRLYIDEKWKSVIKEDAIYGMVEDFIAEHNTKTFQWVTDKPVFFITRPYCRHYFKEISLFEALTTPLEDLISKYHMHTKIGIRGSRQTLNHAGSTAAEMVKQYKKRLAMHMALYRARKSDFLEKAIAKDKFLIAKWEKEL